MDILQVVPPSSVSVLATDPFSERARKDAETIVNSVRDGGLEGLLEYSKKFGDYGDAENPKWKLQRSDLEKSYKSLDPKLQTCLNRVAQNIRTFAEHQRNSVKAFSIPVPGGSAGQELSPVTTAGCYAPGGRYPLPSSVLMTCVTAKTAGVKTVVVCSPRPSPVTKAAAYVAGADIFLACGGAQAIGAMAYGIKNDKGSEGDVPKCDVIVGPGNQWVTAAKALVSGRGLCGIDMLAGPSECLVICDESCSPSTVAADLLAQAEHDVLAQPVLVSVDEATMHKVNEEVHKQVNALPEPNQSTAKKALKRGFAVHANGGLEEACRLSDLVAPEHLEIHLRDKATVDKAWSLLEHYGGLFVGRRSAEVMGDYGAGPNHVLPTGGTARYTGGLSVFTFLRIRTYLDLRDEKSSTKYEQMVSDTVTLARLEGLEGHARAAEKRQNLDTASEDASTNKRQKVK
eukprot:g2047.t1